ncbi:MAG: phospholipase D-like domain-containing protein, partial [Thermocladium sp.]
MKIIPIIIIIMMAAITSIAAAQSNCFISINDNQLSLLIGPSNASYLLRLINSANSSIYVEAYEFTYWPLANELINASRRGVEVMIVLSGNVYGGVPSSEDAIINELNSSGARVRFMYGYDFTHSKVFIIDNETAVLGSINPTYYGLTRDLGIDVVIHNSTVAHELANIIIEDYEGKPIALDYPGIIVSPINSAQCLGELLNMPGPLYMAMEELYPSSGEFGAVLNHGHRYVVLNDYGENQAASMELGARLLGGLTAKAIAINGYVYIG